MLTCQSQEADGQQHRTDAEAEYQGMIAVYDVLMAAEDNRGFKVKNISIPTTADVNDYIALFGSNPFETRCQ